MEVKVYASKSTLGGIVLVLTILVAVFGYLGIGKRYEDVENYREYRYEIGVVMDTESHICWDDEGDEDYNYSVVLEIANSGEPIIIETPNIFHSEPDIGDSFPILFKESGEGTYDYVLAKKDWMTGEYTDRDADYDGNLISSCVLLAFDFIIFAFLLPAGKAQGICIGGGLLFLGVSGIFFVIVAGNLGGIFLLLFGAIGVLVLYRSLFVSPQKQKQMVEDSKNGRLFCVRDVVYNKESGKDMVVFAMVAPEGSDCAYFSYDSEPGTYRVGDWRSANIITLMLEHGRRKVGLYDTLDVSKVPADTFQTLSRAGKEMVKLLKAAGMVS